MFCVRRVFQATYQRNCAVPSEYQWIKLLTFEDQKLERIKQKSDQPCSESDRWWCGKWARCQDHEHENLSDDEDYAEDKPIVNSREHRRKKDHPLKTLREWFHDYLDEFPVLRFHLRKNDSNPVKEFLFPVPVQNEGVQLAIKRTTTSCAWRPTILSIQIDGFSQQEEDSTLPPQSLLLYSEKQEHHRARVPVSPASVVWKQHANIQRFPYLVQHYRHPTLLQCFGKDVRLLER